MSTLLNALKEAVDRIGNPSLIYDDTHQVAVATKPIQLTRGPHVITLRARIMLLGGQEELVVARYLDGSCVDSSDYECTHCNLVNLTFLEGTLDPAKVERLLRQHLAELDKTIGFSHGRPVLQNHTPVRPQPKHRATTQRR